MPSSILNSDDGVISGTSGLKSSGGNDGVTVFQQNGTERMRVTSAGNVGIGTGSPSDKFHVLASGNADNGIKIENDNSSSSAIANVKVLSDSAGGGLAVTSSSFTSGNVIASDCAYVYASSNASNGLRLNAEASAPIIFGTNNTERMRIDSSGRVTMPYQPAFQVENIASRIAAGSVVPWSAVISNRGSHYNSSTHRFTAPVAGYYQFNLSAFTVRTASTGDAYWDIRVNGSVQFRVYQAKTGNADAHAQCMGSMAFDLAVNDYVDVYFNLSPGSVNMETGSSHNLFSGFLLG